MGLGAFLTKSLQELGELKAKSAQNDLILESQNQAIEALIIDTQNYMCDLDSLNAYTKAKYENVIEAHESEPCEVKLESLQQALEIFSE